MSSPRMICSVKFLHPTTMRGRREQEGSTANVNKMMMSAAAGRARLSAAPIINLRNLTARLNVVPSRFEQLRGLPRSTLVGFCMLRGSLWRKPFFQPAQQGIGGQRHQGGGNCARENYIVVDHGESAKNQLPQSTRAYCRSNRRQAHGNHHSYANSGENDTGCERRLNFEQKLPVSQAHAARRLDDRVIHAFDSCVSIADQREKRVERQSQNCQASGAIADPRRRQQKSE